MCGCFQRWHYSQTFGFLIQNANILLVGGPLLVGKHPYEENVLLVDSRLPVVRALPPGRSPGASLAQLAPLGPDNNRSFSRPNSIDL